MKTRMELWKDYRNKIEKNVALQNAVHLSNTKLNVLYNRLLKVFPNYKNKYKNTTISLKARLEPVNSFSQYKATKIINLLNAINDVQENAKSSLSLINEISFSSEELDDVISSIKKGKIKSMGYMKQTTTSKILMEKAKKVKLNTPIKKINIAIDGPSGTGKSSVAKRIAQKYNLIYINTGLVYRAIALNCIDKNIDFKNEKKVINSLEEGMIKLLENEIIHLHNVDVTKKIRTELVSIGASKISQIAKVRKYAVNIQKRVGKSKGIIMDGRDTTFVVLPSAELKIYLDTKPEIRAQRRIKQNKKLGLETNYDKILSNIIKRDYIDTSRKQDPLHKTKDAILIDASNMNLEDVVNKVSKLVEEKMK